MASVCLNPQLSASGGLRFFGGELRKCPSIFGKLPKARASFIRYSARMLKTFSIRFEAAQP